jgi:S-formylglutathione hydrolase FrmB
MAASLPAAKQNHNKTIKTYFIMKLIYFLIFCCWLTKSPAQSHRIIVHLDSSFKTPVSGRLYVFSVTDTSKGVRDPDPFRPTPTFQVDVKGWRGGETKIIDEKATAYPVNIRELKSGYYKFAAVLDVDTLERINTATPGNFYSRDVLAQVQEGRDGETHLYLARRFPERPFRETENIKAIMLKSGLVSAHLKRDAFIKAAVVLPTSYRQDSSKRYPVVFIIPGWGGSHYDVHNPHIAQRYGFGKGKEKIYVYLNPETNNPFGLHAFIDSKVNGPWGKALVEEVIPHVSKHYRITRDVSQRFLVGQSSGGYAALWLHLHYPKQFGGSWSVSPDPVDFRDFLSVNLYDKKANLYYDASGIERPFFLQNEKSVSTIKRYAQFEDFLGTGGQLQSFEAAFGLPAKDGHPQQLFDRKTGVINASVIKAWQAYDLSLFFSKNYKTLAPHIGGRVHVYAGADDDFLLNRPVALLKDRMETMKAGVNVEIISGANHWTIWSAAFTEKVQSEIDSLLETGGK